jgi:uncharacterized membrane protein HdeD (DUF308 family)
MSTGMDAAMHRGYANQNVNMATLIADRWWTLIVRGIAAVGFGVFALIAPRTSLLAIVFVFGAYALLDGVVHLLSAWRNTHEGERGWLIFEGVVSIAAGVVAFAWTELTALLLLMLIGAWAILTGIAKIAAAFRLRRQLDGEWLLATSGALSIMLGVILLVAPGAGTVVLLWIIGVFAIMFGLALIGLGARLRSWRSGSVPSRVVPA